MMTAHDSVLFKSLRGGLLAGVIAASAAHAAPPTQHYWYDGEVRRPLYLDAGRVADFSAKRAPAAPVLKDAALGKALSSGAAGTNPTGVVDPHASTPVFKDAQDASARTRALPGGVIVRLKNEMPEAAAREWLRARGLEPLRPLGEHGGMWLIQAEPGLKSLDMANRLFESGEFAGASPNWWHLRKLK